MTLSFGNLLGILLLVISFSLIYIALLSRPIQVRSAGFTEEARDKIAIEYWGDAEEEEASPFERLCSKYHSYTEHECEVIKSRNKTYMNNITRPFNILSGAPGSGNDWLRWLATFHGVPEECAVYKPHLAITETAHGRRVLPGCLFIKSHEPWFPYMGYTSLSTKGMKTAVLLRHPIDAAFAEFKRQLAEPYRKKNKDVKLKSTAEGISLAEFFTDIANFSPSMRWKKHSANFIRKWLEHATFWLEKYNKTTPYIIIFKDFSEDTLNQLPLLVEFFNMEPTEANLEFTCCASMYPLNPELKRARTDIDEYKDLLFQRTPNLVSSAKQAVDEVNRMLAEKYPGINFTVR